MSRTECCRIEVKSTTHAALQSVGSQDTVTSINGAVKKLLLHDLPPVLHVPQPIVADRAPLPTTTAAESGFCFRRADVNADTPDRRVDDSVAKENAPGSPCSDHTACERDTQLLPSFAVQ